MIITTFTILMMELNICINSINSLVPASYDEKIKYCSKIIGERK